MKTRNALQGLMMGLLVMAVATPAQSAVTIVLTATNVGNFRFNGLSTTNTTTPPGEASGST